MDRDDRKAVFDGYVMAFLQGTPQGETIPIFYAERAFLVASKLLEWRDEKFAEGKAAQ